VWAVAGRPMPGEEVSGDMHVATATSTGTLLAVVDGLGHGPDAAAAARAAVEVLDAHPEEPVTALAARCHQALRRTRGAAISVVSVDGAGERLDWIGIGNVEGRVLRGSASERRADEALLLRAGVVGYRIPEVRALSVDLAPGDLIVLASDGVHAGFSEDVNREAEPQALADELLDRHGKTTDDALVLVARVGGSA